MWLDSTVSRSSDQSSRSQLFAPNATILVAALLAMLTLHAFRLPSMASRSLGSVELVAFALVPVFALIGLRVRFPNLKADTISKPAFYGFQLGGILFGALVVVWHIVARQFGAGVANEILALRTIQCVAWYLAVFSNLPGFEKTSAVLCGALVFFVVCMSERIEIFVVAVLFAIVVLWWLLVQYWSRMEHKNVDGQYRMLRVNSAAIGGTTFVVAVAVFLVTLIPIAGGGVMLSGFMPFSGGQDGMQDRYARSGIGNGDLIRAGRNATTTGAVDADVFIEGHKPSMYDVTSDQYNGPIAKKKRRNRTVAIEGAAKHLDAIKQSEQAGRSFRTMRETGKSSEMEVEERITQALFFVEGSVPARFANNTFHHFDGWDWSNQPLPKTETKMPKIRLDKKSGIPIGCIVSK